MYIFTQIVNIFKDTMKNIQSFSLTMPNSEGWELFSVKSSTESLHRPNSLLQRSLESDKTFI